LLGNKITKRITRKSSASPATGFAKLHMQEQSVIIEEAFKIE